MSIDDLEERTGLSKRTIRYYQSAHLIPLPDMKGRHAVYSEEHVKLLVAIRDRSSEKRLSDVVSRLPGRRIESQHGQRHAPGLPEELVRFTLRDGVELVVSPARSGFTQETLKILVPRIAEVLQANESPHTGEVSGLAWATPKGSQEAIEELRKLGMEAHHFSKLHPKPGETMQKHLAYLQDRTAFRVGSTNVLINHRLQLCVAFLKDATRAAAKETPEQQMDAAVEYAVDAVPIAQWR